MAQKEVCKVQRTRSRRQQQCYRAQQQKEEAKAASRLIQWEQGWTAHQLAQIDLTAEREV
jgi:hypothetical protein